MNSDAPMVIYGKAGPAFERLCPSCGRFLKFPKRIRYRERFDEMCEFQKIKCSKCGPVEPTHIGWGSDFYDYQ
jgi:uncharacterized Zn finger protein